MVDSNSEDEAFDFKNDNFENEPDFSASNITNDQHYRILKEIGTHFFQILAEKNDFKTYYNWNTYSEMEPIEISLEVSELMPGVFDIVNTGNILLNKVISVYTILAAEIKNIMLPIQSTGEYDILYPLVVYGESFEADDKMEDGEAENQIARMLPTFVDLFEKITKLLSIAINVANQTIALYNKNFKSYNDSFKNIALYKPFDYLGKILSFFLAIDTIVSENENLTNHWKLYRLMFSRCKADPNKFGFTEDQAKKLDKILKKIDASILSGKLLEQCVKHLTDNAGDLQSTGQLSPAVNNKEFCAHFTQYMKSKIERLQSEIGSFTETNEKSQLLQYLAILAYYCKIFGQATDKSLFKNIWSIQKKVTSIQIISNVNVNIEKYLLSIRPWGEKNNQVSLDPKNVQKVKMEYFDKFMDNFKYFIMNMRLQIFTWTTRMESNLFSDHLKVEDNLGRLINSRVKLIINGIILATQIKSYITYCLDTHLNEGIELRGELIETICSGLELLKVIENQFKKSQSIIASSMNMLIRIISFQVKCIIDPAEKKITSKNLNVENSYYSDALCAIKIIQSNLLAVPSKLRLIISELCMDFIRSKTFFDSNQMDDLSFNFWKLEIISQLSSEIKKACDCSFFYWYKDIIPECLNNIFADNFDFKRVYFFASAVSDTDISLLHVKYLEDNTKLIKKYRNIIKKNFEDNLFLPMARDIENDLRMQIHSVLIANLQIPNPCKGEVKNLNKYVKLKPLVLFEHIIDIKKYVEDYLNHTFYDMTTLNLNDWKTYQHMRVLAMTKYNLDLHAIYLPSQTVDQGIDILHIVRFLANFVKQYNHNLHSQIFVEVTKENSYVSIIGVQQILNSLYTHGIGIVNSIVNKTYQFLGQRVKTISQFIMDEYIKSSLMLEKRYWNENKEKIQHKYPYERAEALCNDIKSLLKTKDDMTLVDKLRSFLTQIGNALGFARVIRTALMEYNAQNLKFVSNNKNFEELNNLMKNVQLDQENSAKADSPSFLANTTNSFVATNKIVTETLNILDQNKNNTINYLTLLVNSFDNVFTSQNIPDIDLFFYLIPAITISYVENLIVAKDKIFKKNIKDAFFTDDGFIIGIAYLLKVFKQETAFESLHWFESVIDKLDNDFKLFNSMKMSKKSQDDLHQNMSLRKITTYKNEFELLYYTYNSAMILFNDY